MHRWSIIWHVTRVHLLSRLKQSTIAALGVTFGIGTFIILVSFMTGLNGLLDGLILNRTPHVRIFNELAPSEIQPIEQNPDLNADWNIIRSVKPKQSIARIHDALPLIGVLEGDERVRGVTAQTSAKVFYLAGPIELNGLVNGIDVAKEMELFNFSDYIVQGDPMDLKKTNNGILLGAGILKKMSLRLGDRIQVRTAQGGILPLKILGVFQSGLAEVDDVQSYVRLETAQQLLGVGSNHISDIHVKLHDLADAPDMAKRLEQAYGVNAIDIQTANAQFETGTNIRNLITYAVSITLLIVAGFGIYNILNMFIYEKMNDIAILKATGFSSQDVQAIFITQALTIGVLGGILGLVIGYFVSVFIDHTPFVTEALPTIKTYPVNFDPMFYIIGVVFALSSTFMAGYLPSRKAGKLDPVEIIRGQ